MDINTRHANFYKALEDKFRGSRETIRTRLEVYTPYLDALLKSSKNVRVLDLGCGRGEWLELLTEKGFTPLGVDLNEPMLAFCRERGFEVLCADAIDVLSSQADCSLSIVSGFHIAEHLPFEKLQILIAEALRVLRPGGLLILETPNPENLRVSSHTFYIDPTHTKPLPPSLLNFMAEYYGFARSKILRLQESSDLANAKLITIENVYSGVSPDYSVVAQKAADSETMAAADHAFSIEFGISSEVIFDRFQKAIETMCENLVGQSNKEVRQLFEDELKARADLERTLATIRNSISWKVTAPIRLAVRNLQWIGTGIHAWATFKPDSRPHRYLRSAALRAQHLVAGSPFLYSAAHRFLNLLPGVRQRLRRLLLPSELRNVVFSQSKLVAAESFHHAYSVRLANERIIFAADHVDRPNKDADKPAGTRPKLAYFSPLPPEKSGIADYGAQLLPDLSKHYDITLISDHPEISDVWIKENLSIRNTSWFRQNHRNFDRVVYHIGNSLLHSHMLPFIRIVPGVVVLHDFYLGSMLAYLELYGNWGNIWTEALLYSHGYAAVVDRTCPETLRSAIDRYPSNFEIISIATGIIIHNKHSLDLARNFYPAYSADAWEVVPLSRNIPNILRREEARRELGFADDEIIVCAFGFLGPTKQNHRLLEAWLDSPLLKKNNCRLIYVGEAHDDPYCHEIKAKIAALCRDRVSISGYVTRETYRRYLEAADIGVQLRTNSRGETSAAVLDCMSYGIPTIANANGSMAELPEDCVVLLPDDFSNNELSAALIDLVQDEEKRGKLGANAAAYIRENHSVEHAAERYKAAIEKFYRDSETLYDHRKLIEFTRGIQSDDKARLNAARSLASNPNFPRPSKQILVDVSALRHQDLRTGIQRVVRSVLSAWLKCAPDAEYRVQPVWLQKMEDEWRYVYAHQFTTDFMGWPRPDLPDSPVDVGEDDIFLGLDYFAHGVTEASRSGLYNDLKKRGATIVFVVYDILPIKIPEHFPPVSTTVHSAWLHSISSFADRLICISQSVADDVSAWLKDKHHPRADVVDVTAWPLGADIVASSPTSGMPDEAEQILGKIRSQRSFLMVGTIEPRKGYAQVLEAFEQLWSNGSQEILVIVGAEGWKDVPREFARTLPQLLSKLRQHPELGKRLIWLEKVSDEFLECIYANVNALIAASEGEGFGLPLIEAGQHAVPILARDIPVFREVAGDHAFYFSAATGGEFADAIRSWLDLYRENCHPRSEHMHWLTWSESAEALFDTTVGAARKNDFTKC